MTTQDFVDYGLVAITITCAIAVLLFAIGYVWSVADKHFLIRGNDEKVRKNDQRWLESLFNEQCDEMRCDINEHSDNFLKWIMSMKQDEYQQNVIRLETYLNLLNTCALLEIRYILPKEMFWKQMEGHLKSLSSCKDIRSFINTRSNLKGLKIKLLEMEQRATKK